MITDIPEDRWDWKEFDGDPIRDVNRTKIKKADLSKARTVLIRCFSGFLRRSRINGSPAKNFYGDCMENNRRCGL
ncbi:hypothetical protein QNN00_21115 [Bacillus velezensis]|nr:hypothetical protein [Bacillus velezensis]